jgi:hypothetical protein
MKQKVRLKELVTEVGLAIRRPEELVLRWCDTEDSTGFSLIGVLLLNAIFGLAAYGLTMQIHNGALAMGRAAVLTPLAAGGAWMLALPALYIFKSAWGSKLNVYATILAASVTVCFGAWAMLASVPINWFFSLALPFSLPRLLTNVVIFTGVGICMADVFLRVFHALEPERSSFSGFWWLGLHAVIGIELFSLFGIFAF